MPGVIGKFGLWKQNEAGFCHENALVIANNLFQQHETNLSMDITRWSIPKSDWLNFLQQRWRSSIQPAKTRPGADSGSDDELLIAKFRLKLKKVGKITIPFRYDLNQTPYNFTVKVTNRFKGLDLIYRVPEELWTEVRDTVQEAVIKKNKWKKKEKEMKKSKWLWGDLTDS